MIGMSTQSEPLTVERAEKLIRLLTDGLVSIEDKTGEFLLKRELPCLRDSCFLLIETVADGSVIDTKGWKGWEWTHGIALTGLCHVSCRVYALTCLCCALFSRGDFRG